MTKWEQGRFQHTYTEHREAFGLLDAFVPERRQATDVYEFPMYGTEVEREYTDAMKLLDYLVTHPEVEYRLYWHADVKGKPHSATLSFTTDGGMIAGLASWQPDAFELLKQLGSTVGGTYGLAVGECPAARQIAIAKRERA